MAELELNGTTIHYVDEGPREAPALLFSPSMFFDTRMFAAQARRFSERFRVVRYDLRGQGESARHPREELDMDTLAEDAAALIEALGLAPCTFVGNSMGGFIALRLAARRPELLRSAVVLELRRCRGAGRRDGPAGRGRAQHGMAPVIDNVLYFCSETRL